MAHFILSAAVLTGVVLASSASAGTFTDLTSFNNATNSVRYTENFTSVTTFPGASLDRSGNGYSYTITSNSDGLLRFTLDNDNAYLTSGSPASIFTPPAITITFTSGNVTAVGGAFFYTTARGGVASDTPITLTFSDGTVQILSGTSNTSFWGYTSNVPLTSLTFSSSATHRFASIDNLVVGTAKAVPEPATAGILGLSALAICGLRRKMS